MEAAVVREVRDGVAFWSAVAWGVLFIIARLGVEAVPHDSVAAILVALLPVPALFVALWAFIRGVGRADELERRIHLEALAVAFPLSLALLMVLGLLELATDLNRANWSYRHLWPFMVIFWLAGMALARRRYA